MFAILKDPKITPVQNHIVSFLFLRHYCYKLRNLFVESYEVYIDCGDVFVKC